MVLYHKLIVISIPHLFINYPFYVIISIYNQIINSIILTFITNLEFGHSKTLPPLLCPLFYFTP